MSSVRWAIAPSARGGKSSGETGVSRMSWSTARSAPEAPWAATQATRRRTSVFGMPQLTWYIDTWSPPNAGVREARGQAGGLDRETLFATRVEERGIGGHERMGVDRAQEAVRLGGGDGSEGEPAIDAGKQVHAVRERRLPHALHHEPL